MKTILQSTKHCAAFFRQHIVSLAFASIVSIAFMLINMKQGDDYFFQAALADTDCITFGVNFYKTWSGRFFFAFTFPLLMQEQSILFLRILFIISAFIFSFSSIKIVNFYSEIELSNKHKTLFYMSFFMFFASTAGGAVLWLTGAYNYFLPYALYTFVFASLLESSLQALSFVKKCMCILYIICICSYEQTALLMLVTLIFIWLFYKNKQNLHFLLVSFILALITFCVLFFAQGNYIRLTSETATWFPMFATLPVWIKIYAVAQLIFEAIMILNIRFTLFFILILLCACNLQRHKFIQYTLYISSCMFAVTLFFPYFVEALSHHVPYGEKVDQIIYNQYYIFTVKHMIALIISVFILCTTMYALICVLKRKQYIVPSLFIIGSGIVTFAIMGFSPTLYASGYRTQFIMNMSMMIVLGITISRITSNRHLLIANALGIVLCLTQGRIFLEKVGKVLF